jgi:hypothetical protein
MGRLSEYDSPRLDMGLGQEMTTSALLGIVKMRMWAAKSARLKATKSAPAGACCRAA